MFANLTIIFIIPKYLDTEAKVSSIEEYVGKLQENFNIRLAAKNSE